MFVPIPGFHSTEIEISMQLYRGSHTYIAQHLSAEAVGLTVMQPHMTCSYYRFDMTLEILSA